MKKAFLIKLFLPIIVEQLRAYPLIYYWNGKVGGGLGVVPSVNLSVCLTVFFKPFFFYVYIVVYNLDVLDGWVDVSMYMSYPTFTRL